MHTNVSRLQMDSPRRVAWVLIQCVDVYRLRREKGSDSHGYQSVYRAYRVQYVAHEI